MQNETTDITTINSEPPATRGVRVRITKNLELRRRLRDPQVYVRVTLGFDNGSTTAIDVTCVRADGSVAPAWREFVAVFDGEMLDPKKPWCVRRGRDEAIARLDDHGNVVELLVV